MLVENKFIMLMIPRTATTSFLHTCQINNILTDEIRRYGYTNFYNPEDGGTHYHESIHALQKKFGKSFPVIAVKRNQYDLFISLWRQQLGVFQSIEEFEVFNKLKSLSIDDILFFSSNDYNLLNDDDLLSVAIKFCENNGIEILPKYVGRILLLYKPTVWYHRNNKNIRWFDFDKLNELEKWVSDKIEKPFKLVNLNSSKSIECNLKNNDYFKKKFDEIYSKYEIIKETKTLL